MQVFGSWQVSTVDPLGRRAWCVCERCQSKQMFSTEALVDGSARRCDARDRSRRSALHWVEMGSCHVS